MQFAFVSPERALGRRRCRIVKWRGVPRTRATPKASIFGEGHGRADGSRRRARQGRRKGHGMAGGDGVGRRDTETMPVIGLVPLVDVERESLWMLPGYERMLIEAGAVPLMLPLTHRPDVLGRALDACDALLVTGGQDVTPARYGQPTRPCCKETNANRDAMELALLADALARDMPVLGICRGIQALNVHLGGTLYQDIKIDIGSAVSHLMKKPYERGAHQVSLVKGGFLAKLMGAERIAVNSIHHQGIDKLSPRLEPLAYSEDGICEAALVKGEDFAVAVQWHPEILYPIDSGQMRLFQALTDAASLSVHVPSLSYSA